MTGNAATTPPLGEILTADEIARFVARVLYSTSPVVLVDVEPALAALARASGDWRGALGLLDLAGKARTLVPETAGGRAALPRYYGRPYLGDDAYVGAHFDSWSSPGDRAGEVDRGGPLGTWKPQSGRCRGSAGAKLIARKRPRLYPIWGGSSRSREVWL